MELGLHTLFRERSGDPQHFRFLASRCSLRGGSTPHAFCEESEELMQNTDNGEHTSGERADLRPRAGGAHVEPRAWCQLLGRIWTSLRRCVGAEKFRELIDVCKVLSRSGRYSDATRAVVKRCCCK